MVSFVLQRASHTIRDKTRQLLSSLLVSPQVSFQRVESGKPTAWSSNRTWLFQCFGFSGIKQDEVGSKLILNDGTQGLCTTAPRTHNLHMIKAAKSALQPLRRCVSSPEPQGGEVLKLLTGLENTVFTDLISKGPGWNLAQFFFPPSLGDKSQTLRGCCADCCTNWPSSCSIYSPLHCQPAPTLSMTATQFYFSPPNLLIEHEYFHIMQILHWLIFLSLHTANKHSNQSQWLCRTTTSNNDGWQAHYLSLSAKHCLINETQTIKKSSRQHMEKYYQTVWLLFIVAASVKKPWTVAPTSNNTSRTSCGTVSALLGWGNVWKPACKFVFPWSRCKCVLRSAWRVMIWAFSQHVAFLCCLFLAHLLCKDLNG